LTQLTPRTPQTDGSDDSLNQNDSSLTDNNQSVPSMKDEDSILHASSETLAPQCDDNQNNMNNRLESDALNAATGERIRVNLKQLLALYAKLKRQLVEFTEAKANEQSSYKAKCDEMSSQVSEASEGSEECVNNLCNFLPVNVIETRTRLASNAGGL
jgi:hypothetical protein